MAKVKKERLNCNWLIWDEGSGEPLYSPLYGCDKKEFERWKARMGNRCGWNWIRVKRELKWGWYVGPRLRRKYNNRHRLHWSREYLEDKISELERDGMPVTNTALALKLNVHVRWAMHQLKRFDMRLSDLKPRNLHGAPPSVNAFKIG